MGVAHRDLKPENILLDKTHLVDGYPAVKIADFGLAKMVAEGTGESVIGEGSVPKCAWMIYKCCVTGQL